MVSSGFSLSKIVLKYVLDGTEAHDILFICLKSIQEHLSPALRKRSHDTSTTI